MASERKRGWWWWVLLAIAVVFVAIQFVPTPRTNPASDPKLALNSVAQPPPEVAELLDRSCADCHSNDTRWPWYSHVAPVSWLVASDVRGGRGHMNFSEWGKLDANRQARRLKGMCREITRGEMPLPIYTIIHTGANLSEDEKRRFCEWTDQAAQKLGPVGQKAPAETPHGTEAPVTPMQRPDAGQ